MKVRSATINGVKYRLDIYEPHYGTCDSPRGRPERFITVGSDIGEFEGLRVLIEEILHASQWAKEHDCIRQTAYDLSKIVRRIYKLEVKQ